MPAKSLASWDARDLIRRVINALDIGRQMVCRISEAESNTAETEAEKEAVQALLRQKILAETAMLLFCVEPLQVLDGRIRDLASIVAKDLIPFARCKDVRVAICLDPGLAREHAVAHSILNRLGFPDPEVDVLLSKTLEMGFHFGPERLPHRRLEQAWLDRVWSVGEQPAGHDSRLLADSMLGRPMDVLGSSRHDIYAFTHAVMYASDLGGRRVARIRRREDIAADADAALAYSLDSNDFDLTAEVLLTWPMLKMPWSPVASFAFGILAREEDRRGFLPGLAFDSDHYEASVGEERLRYARSTSYHTSYVMGFLCSATLRDSCAPPATVPQTRRSRGAGAALLRFVCAEPETACWRGPFDTLAPRQQDSVAPLLLTMLLRKARIRGDIQLVRDLLETALTHDLVHLPASKQAVALLQRCRLLGL